MPNPQRLVLIGYYGFGNAGDELILTALVRGLRARRPELAIIVPSHTPGETADTHAVESFHWTDTARLLDEVAASDAVLIGGGGLFHDYWGFDPDAFLTDNHSGIGYYTAPAVLALLARKPLMLCGVGVGPLFSEHGREFTRLAAASACAVTVRDPFSRRELIALGAKPESITDTADAAYLLVSQAPPLARRAEAAPVIAVALRDWQMGVSAAAWEREVVHSLDLLMEEVGDARVRFVPFQVVPNGPEDDARLAERIRHCLRQPERAEVAPHTTRADELMARLAGATVVLAMRLHAAVLAICLGRPVVALSYDPKVREAMVGAGLGDFVLDVGALSAGQVAALVRRAIASPEAFREAQARTREKIAPAAERNIDLALDVLNGARPAPSVALTQWAPILLRSLRTHLEESARRRSELGRAVEDVDALMGRTQELTRHLDAAASEQAILREQLQRANAELLVRRAQVQETLAAVQRFTEDSDRQQAENRSQRAYQVMLLLRKGYVLVRQPGWRGKGQALRLLLRAILRKPLELQPYDLTFPNVWTYLPDSLFRTTNDAFAISASTSPGAAGPLDLARLPARQYDLIVLPVFDFEFRFQRPQQIAVEFARRGHRVYWVSPGRHLPLDDPRPYERIPLRPNLFEVRLRRGAFDLYGGRCDEAEVARSAACLQALAHDENLNATCALLQFPFWRRIGMALRERLGATLVYDQMDDWQNWPTEPRIGEFNLQEERALTRESDLLVVTSREFQGRSADRTPPPLLLPNAADFDFFQAAEPHPALADVQGPVVGYYGAIADWFDLDTVTQVAASRPQVTFVLIGQVHGRDVEPLRRLPNVRLLGEKSYRELPGYLRRFDVCLIPFLLNRLTHAVDPVKLYEYLSQGKPVVATRMTELAAWQHLLYFADSPGEFASQVDRALAEHDEGVRRQRVEFARANTWAARVDALDGAIRAVSPLVSVIILGHNSREFLPALVSGLQRNSTYPNWEAILADNASTDGSGELLERLVAGDARLRVLRLERNLGFAGGNNAAARSASGDYLIFLNADTVPGPGWIERLLRPLQDGSGAGMTAPVTNHSGNETRIDVAYRTLPEMEEFAAALARERGGQTMDVSMAPLLCAAVPRAVWEQVGELDEAFGLGMFEDDDFSLRVRRAGYRIVTAEDCFVHHFGGGSFRQLDPEQSTRIFEENRRRFEAKWGVSWAPHRSRPGVRPLPAAPRFTVETFLRGSPTAASATAAPRLLRLRPEGTRVGMPFNRQPDGASAIVVDCENATPDTTIRMGGQLLQTSYGSARLLSAIVPQELYASAGKTPVGLVNELGQSNEILFTVSKE